MGKVAAVLVVLLIAVMAVPLGVALLLTSIAGPASGEQWRTTACQGALPATGQWRPPFQQAYAVTDGFGMRRHPIFGTTKLHSGIDLVSQPGPGPVVAAAAGKVTSAGYRDGAGNNVEIEHAGGVRTRYLHLARPSTLRVGDTVNIGQQVGTEGSTGASTGNHLHFEVRVDGQPVDPAPFMLEHGAPLNGVAVAPTPIPAETETDVGPVLPADGEGGVGFELPEPGTPRQVSLHTPAASIPAVMEELYREAGQQYNVPWTLLAGIGMIETNHDAITTITTTSIAGAQGAMQFMPATFATYGVDGNGDGRVDIHDRADSVYSAANYLVASGVSDGPEGVRDALFAYNHADWYVNDVLYYTAAYGGGHVLADPTNCGPGTGVGNPDLPPLTDERVQVILSFAGDQAGDGYVLGANGPDVWDCSSLTQSAMAQIGVSAPRTAQAQRDWLALGNGFKVPTAQAKPGDLIFYDSYLGPRTIGHVAIVRDPATMTTIEAANPRLGVGNFSYADDLDRTIFEIWRLGSIADEPTRSR